MNYGKLTAGTTKTAIDTAKPSEKGEIITYLSRMGDVLHDVQERREVIVLRGSTVHIVVDGYEPNALFREKDFCVAANSQVISSKTTEILYHKGLHSSGFDFFQQSGKTGTIKVRAGIAVIIEVPDISQPMLTGIFFKIFLLILDGVRFSSLFIISG